MTAHQSTAYRSANGAALEWTRYFSRQLVTPADLTQDQIYFREKMRRHNRLLHGWGIVCGLEVTANATDEVPWQVGISSGHALSPQGDEISVSEPITLDLTEHCLDPATLSGDSARDAYLAIRYRERHTRPVRVQPAGCACADRECEFSRLQDSIEIRVLTELPDTYRFMYASREEWVEEMLVSVLPCALGPDRQFKIQRPCPPPSSDDCNWVLLARIRSSPSISVTRIQDAMIDSVDIRRYVISLGGLYLDCAHLAPWLERLEWTAADTGPLGGLGTAAAAPSFVDLQDAADEIQSRASVVLRRANDTSIALPAAFRVDPGESFASLVKREGNRLLYDPVENKVYRLGELYAVARVDPETRVNNLLEALAPLEGLRIEIAKLREARIGLDLLLDKQGVRRLDAKHLASPARASMLPATDIHGVSLRSQLGKKLAEVTIGDIAEMSLEDFLALACRGVAKRRLRSVERQAKSAWDRATQVDRIARVWRNRN